MRIVPLTLLPLILYNLVAFLFDQGRGAAIWTASLAEAAMPSGAVWVLPLGDVLVALAILLLFVEVLKSTRSTSSVLLDHGLSTLVLLIYLGEFLIVPAASTSTFFILLIIALVDVLAGATVTIRAARRDVTFDRS